MPRVLRHAFAAALVCLAAFTRATAAGAKPDSFPTADLMRLGAYYYPEAWPAGQWPRDMANMKKLGMDFVHMGEFAWAFLEPREGEFDFAWLEKNVQLAHEQGLKVILCTPTPTPPAWLTQKYPDVLMVDAAGRRMQHGTRQQACWSTETYRRHVARIVHELGRRFGQDSRVWGWQLDNELSHYGKEPCYCDACHTKFRGWLKTKYSSIDALNRDWGNAFWSQVYQEFDQIRLPNQQEVVAQMNPHAVLDSQRWFAEETADYLRFQTKILREYCGDRQWVTTNYMHAFGTLPPSNTRDDFEITTWTIYPAHGNAGDTPNLGYRLGSTAAMSWAHDSMRPLTGKHGIMELQPGQVNWGKVNPQPYPGVVRAWLLRAFAGGANFVCTYRYRQPLFGAELYHYGLVGPDGVTTSLGGEQYAQASREMTLLRQHYRPDARLPAELTARRTALVYDAESRWNIDFHPQTARWNTMEHLQKYHRALKRLGAPVDILPSGGIDDLSGYPFVVVPAHQLVDATTVQRWKTYAENGGHLILSCRTGHKDRRGHLWEGPWAMPILELIGAEIALFDVLPDPHAGKVHAGEQSHTWFSWGEVLEPRAGTSTLARHEDQFYAGRTAAVTRKLGRGSVTYIGVDSADGGLEHQLVRDVFARAGVSTADYADGFLVEWRDGFFVAGNFTEQPQTAPIPDGVTPLIGSREVPVAGVAVWQETR
ncbi:MAG TPA: beta-galactosidase [Opitutaceae bacterium]